VLSPGPGYNENIDRPATANGPLVGCSNGYAQSNSFAAVSSTDPATPTAGDGTCLLGGGNTASYGSTTVSGITIAAGSSIVNDAKATLKNEGQQVTFGGTVSLTDGSNSSYTGPVYVGDVSDTAQNAVKGGSVDVGAFELVDAAGNPVTVNGGYTGSITLGALSTATDPFYDAYDPTLGGGDAGAVLISPYIKPGTVSNTYYNHYSLLRTLEDIFRVQHHSSGLDGDGHIGYAAQPGLAPFGSDVFTNPRGWNHVPYVARRSSHAKRPRV
jgi:Phosphoesterase family